MAVAHSRQRNYRGVVLEETDARAGRRGVHVLWILIVSTGLAAIMLLVLLAIEAPALSGPGGQVNVRPPAAAAPPPGPARGTTGA